MQAIQPYLKDFLGYMQQNAFKAAPSELYEPVDYILNLGGKRMRPVMLLMAYHLFKEDYQKALPAAYTVEIFHNFSLVHDDIMDAAPLRRGKATVHHKWDVNTGILSGDAMLVYAYEYLLKIEDKTKLHALVQTFNKAAIEVCEGQQYDVNFETRDDVQIEEYLKMIELKTSVLLAAGMKMGAIVAGASETEQEHVYQFGRNVGIAFQLQDDYLDSFGDPEKFGKKVGGDIIQNKKTYLILKALECADADTRTELLQYITTTPTDEVAKIKAVKRILEQLDIPKCIKELKQAYQDTAFQHLNAIEVADKRKQALIDIANALLIREM
ncbi:MAG: polyprenyl synthetase family protein [Bacteroidota bacterium]